MSAAGSLGTVAIAAARPMDQPVVFVDGAVEPGLVVERYQAGAPTDVRLVTLRRQTDEPAKLERWRGAKTTVAVSRRLVDDAVRWQVLASGMLSVFADKRSSGRQQWRLMLEDAWARRLQQPVPTIAWLNTDGSLVAQTAGALAVGTPGNRSSQRYVVGGALVHVLKQGGEAWTVGSALATVSALAGLNLLLTWLPRAITEATLVHSWDLAAPLERGLARLLEDYGLVIQRQMSLGAGASGSVIERRVVRPRAMARPVTVRWARDNQPVSEVLQIDALRPREAAQKWVAQGAGWRVESTFELVGGWDPSLEGAANGEYGRTTSSDFATYANVYRHWVLNEDGAYTGSPYHRGSAYDLTGLFGQGAIRPQPLRFLSGLTLDDSGDHLSPIVEVSTDSGNTWARYDGSATISTARAAVYFDDATLPSSFLTAATAGSARVRATVSLQAPLPVQMQRWRGNPFAGTVEPRVFDLRQVFGFRRVDPASVHYAAVEAGTRQADELDSTNAMLRWLVNRVDRAEAAQWPGRAMLELSGTWTSLSIGDWLRDADGAGRTVTNRAEALARRGGVVQAIDARFADGGPRTRVELVFTAG